jgi:hypothetical protein
MDTYVQLDIQTHLILTLESFEMSNQFHSSAASPQWKQLPVSIVWVWIGSRIVLYDMVSKKSCLHIDSNSDSLAFQYAASRYVMKTEQNDMQYRHK